MFCTSRNICGHQWWGKSWAYCVQREIQGHWKESTLLFSNQILNRVSYIGAGAIIQQVGCVPCMQSTWLWFVASCIFLKPHQVWLLSEEWGISPECRQVRPPNKQIKIQKMSSFLPTLGEVADKNRHQPLVWIPPSLASWQEGRPGSRSEERILNHIYMCVVQKGKERGEVLPESKKKVTNKSFPKKWENQTDLSQMSSNCCP